MAYAKLDGYEVPEVTIAPDIESGPSLDRSAAHLTGKIGTNPGHDRKAQTAVLIPGAQGNGSGSDSNAGGNAGDAIRAVFESSAHPLALASLLFFKSLPVVAFVLGGWVISSSVLNLVLIILFSSTEFWVVKNISGRLLVGLRWWNEVREDGSSIWLFESRDPARPANATDSKIFWVSVYSFTAAWIVLFLFEFFTFSLTNIPVIVLAIILNTSNMLGFTYADRDARRKWSQGIAAQSAMGGVFGGDGLFGGIATKVAGGLVRGGLGKVFG